MKQVRETLWICGADQNQRMKGESSHLCKLPVPMESRVIQIAKADSVINGVFRLNITQNVLPPLITVVPL